MSTLRKRSLIFAALGYPIFAGDPTTAVDRLRKALERGLKKLPAVG